MRFFILFLALTGIAACNTVQGVGQDIEAIGKKSEEIIDGE